MGEPPLGVFSVESFLVIGGRAGSGLDGIGAVGLPAAGMESTLVLGASMGDEAGCGLCVGEARGFDDGSVFLLCGERVDVSLGDPWVIQLTSMPCTCSMSRVQVDGQLAARPTLVLF